LGSLLAVGAITLLAYCTGASRTTVILSGVALNSIFHALTEAVSVLVPDVTLMNMDFRVGGFSSVSYEQLLPAACLIVIASVVVLSLHDRLDVLSLGDDTAAGLGLKVKRCRFFFLLLAAVLAGAAVSFSGLLGFVGLIIPHLSQKLMKKESQYHLPMSALCGAALVTLCDTLARLLFLPYELPVGLVLSLIGGPVFIGLLFRHRGGSRYA